MLLPFFIVVYPYIRDRQKKTNRNLKKNINFARVVRNKLIIIKKKNI